MTYSDTRMAVPDWYWYDDDQESPDDVLTDWTPVVNAARVDNSEYFADTYVTSDHINLTAIRETAGMTPRELGLALSLADTKGLSTTVRQMERRRDFLVSRLAAFIHAAGGTAELIVDINGQRLKFKIT